MKTQFIPIVHSKKIAFALLLMCILVFVSITHAQADRIGSGGDWSEADLKRFLSRLGPYLNSKRSISPF